MTPVLWFHGGMMAISGVRARPERVTLVLATILLLGGCATVPADVAPGEPTPTVTPTVACPQVDGTELPPECAPYDPDHAMEQNDRHRERMETSAEARAAAEQPVADLRVRLEALRTESTISVTSVEDALREVGLVHHVARGDARAVAFGADGPKGGCVFGEVRPDEVHIEVGGYIMDGGCLPAE